MKKLILLTLLAILSWRGSSQTDTVVRLQQPIAKMVIKDLIKGDGLELQLDKKQQELKLILDKMKLKNKKIFSLNSKINNLNLIIDSKQKQFDLQQNLSKDLKKELRVKKRNNLFYKIASIAGILTSLLLVISK